MTVIREKEINRQGLMQVAEKMVLAARTAPKARGIDTLEVFLATGETIKMLSDRMKEIAVEYDMPFFNRDAENILNSHVIFLAGTGIRSIGLKKCGMCGFVNCEEKDKHPEHPCAFNTGDLGIAIGSAAAVAMDNRADNRIMYTVGQAAMDLKMFGREVKVAHGIPLCASSKNPFFDRK